MSTGRRVEPMIPGPNRNPRQNYYKLMINHLIHICVQTEIYDFTILFIRENVHNIMVDYFINFSQYFQNISPRHK